MRPAHILPIIIVSQFTGTSLWFAGNAVVADLQTAFGLTESAVGYITSAVQLGFILGTLVFAFLSIADRFSPRRVFFLCSLLGAAASAALLVIPESYLALLLLRMATGFFLAGIYPVGMKIAAGWYAEGLGRALGYLVGALVLGTAFPHLLKGLGGHFPWQTVIIGVSALAVGGGFLMLAFVPDGPHLPRGSAFNPRVFALIFRSASFRASALGYFGHMWELYTFWAFVPLWLAAYVSSAHGAGMSTNVPLWSFFIIAAGFIGCAGGGLMAGKMGSARVAAIQLLVSGLCCIVSPWFFDMSLPWLLGFLLIWGACVVGDSPQFSTLNAVTAPREYVGSALTIANCLGFLTTVISIQLVSSLLPIVGHKAIFWCLIPGPLLGLLALRPLLRKH